MGGGMMSETRLVVDCSDHAPRVIFAREIGRNGTDHLSVKARAIESVIGLAR